MDNFLRVNGANLLNQRGEKIVLHGVNKMFIFEQDLNKRIGTNILPEIAKTGANCVRIAWSMQRFDINKVLIDTSVQELDDVITNCKAQGMIPIVGLWDFTGDTNSRSGFDKLELYANFWVRPDVVRVLQKHENSLIINIANEAAPECNDSDEQLNLLLPEYINSYRLVISKIRSLGIKVPLMIDGLDFGKSLKCFSFIRNGHSINTATELLDGDLEKNLIFSFHPYWSKKDTDGQTFVEDIFNQAVADKYCFVIGELSKYGAFAGSNVSVCSDDGIVDYLRFARLCSINQIGYMLWEWGPGNEKAQIKVLDTKGNPVLNLDGTPKTVDDTKCVKMNMTSDGTFTSIHGWGSLIFGISDFNMSSIEIFRAKGKNLKKVLVGHNLTFTWNIVDPNQLLNFKLTGIQIFRSGKQSLPVPVVDIPIPPNSDQGKSFNVKFTTKGATEKFESNYILEVTNLENLVIANIPLENRD